jgi:hypothetical protein
MRASSLHSGAMLKINCPVSYKLYGPHPFPKAAHFSTPHAHTSDIISTMKDNIGVCDSARIKYKLMGFMVYF